MRCEYCVLLCMFSGVGARTYQMQPFFNHYLNLQTLQCREGNLGSAGAAYQSRVCLDEKAERRLRYLKLSPWFVSMATTNTLLGNNLHLESQWLSRCWWWCFLCHAYPWAGAELRRWLAWCLLCISVLSSAWCGCLSEHTIPHLLTCSFLTLGHSNGCKYTGTRVPAIFWVLFYTSLTMALWTSCCLLPPHHKWGTRHLERWYLP